MFIHSAHSAAATRYRHSGARIGAISNQYYSSQNPEPLKFGRPSLGGFKNVRRSRGRKGNGGQRSRDNNGQVQRLDVLLEAGQFEFGREEPIFGPGDTLSGSVSVVIVGTLRFKVLSVTLRGVVRIFGTDSASEVGIFKRRRKETEEVVNIEEKRFLRGGRSSSAQERLPEGRHEFPFEFALPSSPHLPTSFEGENGSVRYFLKLELDESYAVAYHAYKAFTFVQSVDVTGEEFQSPISKESEPSVGMKFLEGPVHSTVSVDRTGFCPSEAVRVAGTFHNISPGAVKAEVSLTQVQTYLLKQPREKRVRVATGETIQIGSGCDGHFGNKSSRDVIEDETSLYTELKVPSIAPTISNCPLLKVDYAVEVHVSGKGQISSPAVISLPVTIGAWPRPEEQVRMAAAARVGYGPTCCQSRARAGMSCEARVRLPPPSPSPSSSPPPPMPPEEDPPSYNEAVTSAGQVIVNVAEEEEEEQESEPPPTIAEAAASASAARTSDGDEELDTVIYGGDTEFSPRYSPRPEVQGFSFDGSNYSI